MIANSSATEYPASSKYVGLSAGSNFGGAEDIDLYASTENPVFKPADTGA